MQSGAAWSLLTFPSALQEEHEQSGGRDGRGANRMMRGFTATLLGCTVKPLFTEIYHYILAFHKAVPTIGPSIGLFQQSDPSQAFQPTVGPSIRLFQQSDLPQGCSNNQTFHRAVPMIRPSTGLFQQSDLPQGCSSNQTFHRAVPAIGSSTGLFQQWNLLATALHGSS